MLNDISSAKNNCWEFISDDHHQRHAAGGTGFNHDHRIEDKIYTSDEFRMYAYKIKRCPRTRSHDWTECPYAHRGEKAQRRDPRRFRYSAVVCAAFRDTGGCCPKGDACEYAHGVFEYWLHPAKYRTRACNAGKSCQRKVCFFAHSPGQLRPETNYSKHYQTQFSYRPTASIAAPAGPQVEVDDDDGGDHCDVRSPTPLVGLAPATATPVSTTKNSKDRRVDHEEEVGEEELFSAMGGISDLLKNLRGLSAGGSREIHEATKEVVIRIKETGGVCGRHQMSGLGLDALSGDEELQRLGWISELLD